jgi:predicted acyltransferase
VWSEEAAQPGAINAQVAPQSLQKRLLSTLNGGQDMRNLFSTLAATVLATAGLLGAMPEAKADSLLVEQKLVFSCEVRNNQYATIPQLVRDVIDPQYPLLGERYVVQEYSPLLIWTATLGSDHPDGAYMPEGRCQAVSARLTNLAASMGITNIQQLSQAGIVNDEHVIFVSESPVAAADDVVFTLKPTNRDDASQILQQFQVGVSGGIGGPDLVIAPLPIYE